MMADRIMVAVTMVIIILAAIYYSIYPAHATHNTAPSVPQWYWEGADKPYPTMRENAWFAMGDRYPVEASYLLRRNGDISQSATIRVTYQIEILSGAPDFVAMECNNAPDSGTVGIMIRKSTSLTREHDRFWYQGRLNLNPGTYTLVAPLSDKARWSSVYGKTALQKPDAFKSLLNNVRDIALTFGGCSHYGHGVKVKGGNARFTIVSVSIS